MGTFVWIIPSKILSDENGNEYRRIQRDSFGPLGVSYLSDVLDSLSRIVRSASPVLYPESSSLG